MVVDIPSLLVKLLLHLALLIFLQGHKHLEVLHQTVSHSSWHIQLLLIECRRPIVRYHWVISQIQVEWGIMAKDWASLITISTVGNDNAQGLPSWAKTLNRCTTD